MDAALCSRLSSRVLLMEKFVEAVKLGQRIVVLGSRFSVMDSWNVEEFLEGFIDRFKILHV